MLTDAQKARCRYHLGYPVYGDEATQGFGHRFLHHYGTLEYRMNHLRDFEETTVTTMLTKLDELEDAIDGSGDNMDTDVAAVWERNRSEMAERERLYLGKRRRLSRFFGVPLNQEEGSNTVRLVV